MNQGIRLGANLSSRVTSCLTGMLLAAIVLTGVPGLGAYTTRLPHGLQRTTVPREARPEIEQALQEPTPFAQSTVADYLERVWKLEHPYASQVAGAVMTSSRRHGLDPLLLMAVAATESAFKHWVGNPGGGKDPMKPYGIMQIAGRYHTDKFPGGSVKPTSVAENVDIGAQVLKEYLAQEGGNERRALLRYNGSLNLSDKYFKTVRRWKTRMLHGLMAQTKKGYDDEPT